MPGSEEASAARDGHCDHDPAFVVLCRILKMMPLAKLFYGGLDLLYMICRVDAFPDDDMQVILATLLTGHDSLFRVVLCLFDMEAMKVNLVLLAAGVVCSEDIQGSIHVCLFHVGTMALATCQ